MMKEDVYPIFFEKEDSYSSIKNFTKYCMTTRKVCEFLSPPLRQRLYSGGKLNQILKMGWSGVRNWNFFPSSTINQFSFHKNSTTSWIF
jgi:hypothetical protein